MAKQPELQDNPRRGWRWGRIALVVSLAVNLLVVGLVVGALIASGGPGGRGETRLRDLGFGPLALALSREDKRAMHVALRRESGSFRENRAALRRDFEAFLAALRAEPHDPAEIERLINAQRTRVTERVALGQRLLLERIEAMSPEERRAYADRLDRAIRRGPRRE